MPRAYGTARPSAPTSNLCGSTPATADHLHIPSAHGLTLAVTALNDLCIQTAFYRAFSAQHQQSSIWRLGHIDRPIEEQKSMAQAPEHYLLGESIQPTDYLFCLIGLLRIPPPFFIYIFFLHASFACFLLRNDTLSVASGILCFTLVRRREKYRLLIVLVRSLGCVLAAVDPFFRFAQRDGSRIGDLGLEMVWDGEHGWGVSGRGR